MLSYLPVGVPSMLETPGIITSHDYSLYPFLSSRALPWYMSTAAAFRIRRVHEWLAPADEDVTETGGLTKGMGRILTVGQSVAHCIVCAKNSQFKQSTCGPAKPAVSHSREP